MAKFLTAQWAVPVSENVQAGVSIPQSSHKLYLLQWAGKADKLTSKLFGAANVSMHVELMLIDKHWSAACMLWQ